MSVSSNWQPFRGGDCQKWGLLNYKANTIKWLLVLGSRVRKKYLLIIVLNKHLSKDHLIFYLRFRIIMNLLIFSD